MEEVDEYLKKIGFKRDGIIPSLDKEETGGLHRYSSLVKKDSHYMSESTHTVMRSPETGRTIVLHIQRGVLFKGFIHSSKDIQQLFRLLKK